MPRALVAMSGGVDSAASALLMKQKGFDVYGVTLILDGNEQDAVAAKNTADLLGINHYSVHAEDLFKNKIINSFIDSYCLGETPNPCIVCNKEIKFGLLYSEMLNNGFDVLCTGHYARLYWDETTQEPRLTKAFDEKKDQSYVLYQIPRERFQRVIFPLGGMIKSEVREVVANAGIDCCNKPESQDICFIKDGDYAAFITDNRDNASVPGFFYNTKGDILGEHKGLINYTVGQRRGLGIPSSASYYVLKKNKDNNSITLGYEDELYVSVFSIHDINVLCPSLWRSQKKYKVRTRYHQVETQCSVVIDDDKAIIFTDNRIRMPAPGQSAVIYDNDIVIAGGIID